MPEGVEQIVAAVPTGAALGAMIEGVDLSRPLNNKTFAAIHAAWIEHGVLVFRGQTLTDTDFVAFSSRFGKLDHAPIIENGQTMVEGVPELYVISNIVKDGKPIGSLGAGEASWHTDMSYEERPPKASALYALEIPPEGGDTWFLNMYAALEALPPTLRAQLESARLRHDSSVNSGGYLRAGFDEVADVSQVPGASHPAVPVHPESGRPVLYLGRRLNSYVEGMMVADSEALLDELWRHVEQDRFTYRHRWRVG
ncbi:MAG: TauD/TfdA family dioxygenase, partial [Alphaproteobacteria bacterium]|nr:TauD/TfdA family dioxygenase [Alphaproteobacteria bacterium]